MLVGEEEKEENEENEEQEGEKEENIENKEQDKEKGEPIGEKKEPDGEKEGQDKEKEEQYQEKEEQDEQEEDTNRESKKRKKGLKIQSLTEGMQPELQEKEKDKPIVKKEKAGPQGFTRDLEQMQTTVIGQTIEEDHKNMQKDNNNKEKGTDVWLQQKGNSTQKLEQLNQKEKNKQDCAHEGSQVIQPLVI